MRLHELFEAPFTPPGLSYIVNNPQQEPQTQPAINPNSSIGTAPAPPTTVTSPQKTPQTMPNAASPTMNTAQTGSNAVSAAGNNNTGNPAGIAAANQQLTKGAPINLPLGPNKQQTPMKVTDVSNQNTMGGNQKMVTVGNSQNPTAPQQTYPASDLANIIANKGNA